MNIFDIAIVLLILMMGIIGMKRGIIKELVITLGTILVFVLAFLLKDFVASFLCTHLPFFKVNSLLGGLSSLSILFYQLLSFAILLFIFHFILRIIISISGIFSKLVNATIILALPNKLLGLIVGLLEGYLLTFIILNVLAIPLSNNELFIESNARQFIVNDTPVLSDHFGGLNKVLEEVLKADKKDINKNNLMVIDTLLKYKVVTTEFMDTLVKEKKLQDIKGVEEVIQKYQ